MFDILEANLLHKECGLVGGGGMTWLSNINENTANQIGGWGWGGGGGG
jgi:hypothetical protein